MKFVCFLSILIFFFAFSFSASDAVESTMKGNVMSSTLSVPEELTGTLALKKILEEANHNVCPVGQDFILNHFENGRDVVTRLYFEENTFPRIKIEELVGKIVSVTGLQIVNAAMMEDYSTAHCYMLKVSSIVEVK